MRGLFTSGLTMATYTFSSLRRSAAREIDKHLGIYWHPEDWRLRSALYVRLPFTRLSLLVDLHEINLGRGIERTTEGWDIWLGHWEAHFCREHGEMYCSSKGAI